MPIYRIQRGQQRYSAPDFATLQEWVRKGRVGVDDYIWSEGWSEWQKASQIRGLQEIYQGQKGRSKSTSTSNTAPKASTSSPQKSSSNKSTRAPSSSEGGWNVLEVFDDEQAFLFQSLQRSKGLQRPARWLSQQMPWDKLQRHLRTEGLQPLSETRSPFLWQVWNRLHALFGVEVTPLWVDHAMRWRLEALGTERGWLGALGEGFLDLPQEHQLFFLAGLCGQGVSGAGLLRQAAHFLNAPDVLARLKINRPSFSPDVFVRWLTRCDEMSDRIGLCVIQEARVAQAALSNVATQSRSAYASSNASHASLAVYISESIPFARARIGWLRAFSQHSTYLACTQRLKENHVWSSTQEQLHQLAFSK